MRKQLLIVAVAVLILSGLYELPGRINKLQSMDKNECLDLHCIGDTVGIDGIIDGFDKGLDGRSAQWYVKYPFGTLVLSDKELKKLSK